MNCQLTWISDPHFSTIYALRSRAMGRTFVDEKLADALTEFAQRVDLTDPNWRDQQVKLNSPNHTATEHQTLLRAANAKITEFHPRLTEELLLRQRPLRELWEAHGPGLLHQISGQQPLELPPKAQIVTVLPFHGGGGEAIAEHQSVVIENVLANPISTLPEILRLAWLIAQLSPNSDPQKLISSCLAAGCELGIVHGDLEHAAQKAWLPSTP
ncbi:MAG: hypothetical protein GY768_05590 [Planctomycetaceae bacterium]|nr:hypothetical protein [Planctomycetaceae bacterium]